MSSLAELATSFATFGFGVGFFLERRGFVAVVLFEGSATFGEVNIGVSITAGIGAISSGIVEAGGKFFGLLTRLFPVFGAAITGIAVGCSIDVCVTSGWTAIAATVVAFFAGRLCVAELRRGLRGSGVLASAVVSSATEGGISTVNGAANISVLFSCAKSVGISVFPGMASNISSIACAASAGVIVSRIGSTGDISMVLVSTMTSLCSRRRLRRRRAGRSCSSVGVTSIGAGSATSTADSVSCPVTVDSSAYSRCMRGISADTVSGSVSTIDSSTGGVIGRLFLRRRAVASEQKH